MMERGDLMGMEVPRVFPQGLKIFIIGGGRACKALLETLMGDTSIEILGLAEINPEAEALPMARQLGIPIYEDYRVVLDVPKVDLILNLTGDKVLEKELRQLLQERGLETEVLGGLGGRLLWAVLVRKDYLACTDPLTGLFNVAHFYKALEEELERGMRYGSPFAILFMDVDNFKDINDRLGHLYGDRVLKAIGEAIQSSLRGSDMAARYGGDEFTVILPETQVEGAVRVAERVRSRVEALGRKLGVEPLTLSIGIAVFPLDGITSEELVRRADWAMYQAKKMGGNRVFRLGTGKEPPAFFRVEDALSLISERGARDKYHRSHSEVVSKFSVEIGKAMGLNRAMVRLLRIAGALHDVGKAEVASGGGEWDYEEHPLVGAYMLRHVPYLRGIVPMVLYHHERFDGKGFPKGLKGKQIPQGAQVVYLANRLHHLLEHRPQWKVGDVLEALMEVRKDLGSVDPSVVDAFYKSLEKQPRDKPFLDF